MIFDENINLVGKTLDEVSRIIGNNYRIVMKDGEHFCVTMDYVPTRYNLSVVNGVVVSVSMG